MIGRNVQAVVLAAGKSKRLNTDQSKLLEPICGKAMVLHTTTLLELMHIPATLIVGYQKEHVEQAVKQYHTANNTFTFVTQTEQLGTGHALKCSQPTWTSDHILVMNGDAPLLTQQLLEELIENHLQNDAAMSFMVSHNFDPSVTGYGFVVTEDNIVKIVESRHFQHEQRENFPINGGIYIFKRSFLESVIDTLPRNPVSGEYYLTTLAEMASMNGLPVITVETPFDHVRGVNTLRELWVAEQIKRSEIIDHWMKNGVRFFAPQNVIIDETVRIGRCSTIGCGAHLLGKTIIGENVSVGPFCILRDTVISDNCILESHIVVNNSVLTANRIIKPFMHIENEQIVQTYTPNTTIKPDISTL